MAAAAGQAPVCERPPRAEPENKLAFQMPNCKPKESRPFKEHITCPLV